MKLLLSCDQVFDVLTRGPFPAGNREDHAVQRHLEGCHECRQLAEALRPAVELLHEALPAEEAADLPAYGGVDEGEVCRRADGALAARIRTMLDRQDVHPRRITREEKWLQAAKFLAASVLVVALGTMLVSLFSEVKQAPRGDRFVAGIDGPLSPGHQPSASGLLRLTSFHLPADCLPGLAPKPADGADGPTLTAAHACCTRCHAAGKSTAALTPRTIATLAASCSACHPKS